MAAEITALNLKKENNTSPNPLQRRKSLTQPSPEERAYNKRYKTTKAMSFIAFVAFKVLSSGEDLGEAFTRS